MVSASFDKASVRDAEVDGRTVLVRADLNVPLSGGALKAGADGLSGIPAADR